MPKPLKVVRDFLVLVFVAAVSLVLLVGLYVAVNPQNAVGTPPINPTESSTPPQTTASPTATSYPASDVQVIVPAYMRISPNVETKIYLVSATPTYGVYPENVQQQLTNLTVVNKGDPIFILNVTLRNDYTSNDSVPSTANSELTNGTQPIYIILTAKLFDMNGNEINATNISNPSVLFTNRNQFVLTNGETDTIDIVLATPNRNVDHVIVTVWYMGSLPMP